MRDPVSLCTSLIANLCSLAVYLFLGLPLKFFNALHQVLQGVTADDKAHHEIDKAHHEIEKAHHEIEKLNIQLEEARNNFKIALPQATREFQTAVVYMRDCVNGLAEHIPVINQRFLELQQGSDRIETLLND